MNNQIRYRNVAKADIISGVSENSQLTGSNVSQNYPNPFNGTTKIYVSLNETTNLSLQVTNLMGQVVYTLPEKSYSAGNAELIISSNGLDSGVYFYTVRSGENSVTKKMIVE